MKAVRIKIGQRIRYFRSRRGLTQKELVAQGKISEAEYDEWRYGKK